MKHKLLLDGGLTANDKQIGPFQELIGVNTEIPGIDNEISCMISMARSSMILAVQNRYWASICCCKSME